MALGYAGVVIFRLVGRIEGREVCFDLPQGRVVLGSGPECDLCLDHATISRRHAELRVGDDLVEFKDLGSRNGVHVGNREMKHGRLEPGMNISFGTVRLELEAVSLSDAEIAMDFGDGSPGQAPTGAGRASTTFALRPAETFAIQVVPQLLRRLARGVDSCGLAQAAASELFELLPTLAVEVTSAVGEGVLYRATRPVTEGVKPVEMVVTAGDISIAVTFPNESAMRLLRPIVMSVGSIVEAAAQAPQPQGTTTSSRPSPPDPPSVEPAMRRLYEQAERVAQGDVGVLVCGESGTGKELLARYIHAASPCAGESFVALNCAALPRDLLEAELFGIERGVATGVEPRPGKFELAHGGTLFLDEIADMALETQARILRVLQEHEVHRLGASSPRPAVCRVIAATNRDLESLRATGGFREDLYYRIATWVVEVPALRHRRRDIPNLAAHFLREAATKRAISVRGISRQGLDILMQYPWPGNVRQLENEMARAALFLPDGGVLDTSRLSAEILAGGPAREGGALEERLERVERYEILRAFERAGGVVSEAATILGISRSTLYRRMKALDIETPQR